MKALTNTILLALVATTAIACVDNDPVSVSQDDAATNEFRQGLIGVDDISMEFKQNDGERSQALAGDLSQVALLTADAVINTNIFLVSHLVGMRLVTALPPTAATENSRLWQGDSDGITYRVFVERKQAPKGVRYDYIIAGKPSDAGEDAFLPIVDGDIVRMSPSPTRGKQGFGVVRFNFTNINTLSPDENIGGMARIAFRKVGGVKQVHSRLLNVHTPEDPDFPQAAEYAYTNLPNGGGAMKWFSVGDVLKDGAPFEKVAVHSIWRADHSGIGEATVFDGSLDVDYWQLGECWGANLIKGYERLETPGMTNESGDPVSCFNLPNSLDIPDYIDALPDKDPEIPAAHPDEM